MAAYPAVIAYDAFPQRYPQVLAVFRSTVRAAVGMNESGTSRSRNDGNVGVGAVADIVRCLLYTSPSPRDA